MENNQKNKEKRDLKNLFSINNILSQAINFAAYLIMIGSAIALVYISLVKSFKFDLDWTTIGIFTGAAVILSWINWSTWYTKQYEKTMENDIKNCQLGKYSIHARYYNGIKDFTDAELQLKIDAFNKEYTEKWLRYVERITGKPIETKQEVVLDKDGSPELMENGDTKIIVTKGMKDLPYWGFKHPILMWRIKNHRYPQSGYKTSMELMSLLSFQESGLNKRKLHAHRTFHIRQSIRKFLSSLMAISISASILPEFIDGSLGSALLKLIIALGSLGLSVLMGALKGVQGARLKLSTVEEVCFDLEEWSHKKPIIAPYVTVMSPLTSNKEPETSKTEPAKNINGHIEVTEEIFNLTNLQNK